MSKIKALDYQKINSFFKALSNEDRFLIVKLLKEKDEAYAQDIERQFYFEQSTTSHHLNMLKKAGIAKSRKEGRKIFYSLDLDNIQIILSQLTEALAEDK